MTMRVEDIPVDTIIRAAGRSDVVQVMGRLYADLDARIAVYKPACGRCGKCCDFDKFGHNLYVTSLEVAYYLSGGRLSPEVKSNVCPHLIDDRCLVRERRTVACRVFYCAPDPLKWQGPLIEEFHGWLRHLHDEFNVYYIYADWLTVLKALSRTS